MKCPICAGTGELESGECPHCVKGEADPIYSESELIDLRDGDYHSQILTVPVNDMRLLAAELLYLRGVIRETAKVL